MLTSYWWGSQRVPIYWSVWWVWNHTFYYCHISQGQWIDALFMKSTCYWLQDHFTDDFCSKFEFDGKLICYVLHLYVITTIFYTCHDMIFAVSWASCQIRKIAGAHAPGMPGTFSPSPQVSDPDMHHGTCVTHVPWCMPGSLTSSFLWNRRRGKTFPAFPAHAQPAILRIW